MNLIKNNVLIVDDDIEDFRMIAREFQKYNINSIYAVSAEEMEEKLPEIYHKLTAIILDIKGKKKTEQELENPDFILRALRILDTDKNYQKIRKFIVSGSPKDFEKFKNFNSEIDSYTKDLDDINKLAKKIVEYSFKKEEIKIRDKYKDVFDAIARVGLGSKRERNLQEILINQDTNDKREITNYLGIIRRINEHIYKSVANLIPEIKDKSTFAEINKFLAGNRDYRNNKGKSTTKLYYLDNIVEQNMNTIHWVGSGHGAHDDETLELIDIATDTSIFPTNYTLKTLLYGLLDIILWYDKIKAELSKKME
jgi:hypothetical protein